MKISTLQKGMMFAFITAIISGISIFYSKISVTKIDPLVLTTARNLYVGILFFLIFLISTRLNEIKKLTKKQLVYLILIGIIGGSIPFYLFFTGLSSIGASSANLIHKGLFIWVTILAFVFLKEKLKPLYILSFILIFLGNFYFAKFKLQFSTGEFMVLTASVLWAVENILAKKILRGISSDIVGLFRMGFGSMILIFTTFTVGKGHILLNLNIQQLTFIFIGGSLLFFYVFFWYRALKFAPASLVAMVLVFATVVGNFLNGSFANIKLSPNDINSSIAILIGISLIYLKPLTGFVISRLKKNG